MGRIIFFTLTIFFFMAGCNGDILKRMHSHKALIIKDKTIGKIDFTQLKQIPVSPSLSIVKVYPDIVFYNCTFTDSIIAFRTTKNKAIYTEFYGNVVFYKCKFHKPVIFKQSQFYRQTKFKEDTFYSFANYEGAGFLATKNNFSESSFKQKASFSGAKFLGEVNFMRSEFYQAFFSKTVFNDLVNFSACKFEKYLSLYDIRANDFFFNYVKVHGEAILKNCYFMTRTEFIKFSSDTVFKFSDSYFYGRTKLVKPKIKGKIFVNNLRFYGDTIWQLPSNKL